MIRQGQDSRKTRGRIGTGSALFRVTWAWLTLAFLLASPAPAWAAGNLSAIWANDGGDKVTQDELRASGGGSVLNSLWDGSSINLFGARNETVSFNLVLEAASTDAAGVSVSLDSLAGARGAHITSTPATGDGVFNYVGRHIELFQVCYLQILGLTSGLAYDKHDERQVPSRCQRPWTGEGDGQGGWNDRPCHDKFFPEIAAPLEWVGPFAVRAGSNQSIWCDIYIPKQTPAGQYHGTVVIAENGAPDREIPVTLQVRGFTLPDLPSCRTMLYLGREDITYRYLGQRWLDEGSQLYPQWLAIADRHFQMAHRHKISLITEGDTLDQMDSQWLSRLDGSLFTPAQGYDGVGEGMGNNVFSIGTYGSWEWQSEGREAMWTNSDAWVNWFEAKSLSTPTEYFLYLVDESDDYAQTEQWAAWMDQNPGPGGRLDSMATIGLPQAQIQVPSLDIPTTSLGVGIRDLWQAAADHYTADPDKLFYFYNGTRPASGSFAIEDDGVALRANGWIQFKKKIDRWFYWESTYYTNYQCYGYGEAGDTNVLAQAMTYGCDDGFDESTGRTGWNYFNGDGVLFYPGTDTRFPQDSQGRAGPMASLRLKHWRRGIQDMDYLVLAQAVDPVATGAIVERMVPKVLWDHGVDSQEDPTYVYCDLGWSINPDDWEAARKQLADIIEPGQ